MRAAWITNLLELQDVDLKIKGYEIRLELLPQEMLNLKAERDKTIAAVNQAAEDARKFERSAKAAESEIAALQEESKKLEQQSAMVKKNTEYQAMLSTIALNKQKISDLESKVIDYLEKFEEGKKDYRKAKAAGEAALKDLKQEFDELGALAEDLKQETAELKKQRPVLAAKIEQNLLRIYEHLLKSKTAPNPLVPVNGGICGGCHMRVTPQTMTNMAKGAITQCDNCQHLVYNPEEE